MNEAEITCGSLVVARRQSAGAFHLVEATLDLVSQGVGDAVDGFRGLAVRSGGNDRRSAVDCDGVANMVGVVALVRDEHFRGRERINAQQVEAFVVGDLASADLRFHQQTVGVGDQVDFRRDATRCPARDICIAERDLNGQNPVSESPVTR